MTRNQLLLISIPILFLLFLFFTRNRAEEARKAHHGHPTDIVSRIKEHNANADRFGFGGAGLGGANNSFGNAPNYGNTPSYGSTPTTTPVPQKPKQDDYYPPSVPKNPKANSPQSQVWPIPPGIRPFFLSDGRPIAFRGERVFTVTQDGLGKPLADGFYSVFNGKLMIMVRDGKKIVN